MPTWVKVATDAWTATAGVADGYVFRPVNRAGHAQGVGLSEKVVWQLLQGYAAAAGVPGIAPHDLRRYAESRTASVAITRRMSRFLTAFLMLSRSTEANESPLKMPLLPAPA